MTIPCGHIPQRVSEAWLVSYGKGSWQAAWCFSRYPAVFIFVDISLYFILICCQIGFPTGHWIMLEAGHSLWIPSHWDLHSYKTPEGNRQKSDWQRRPWDFTGTYFKHHLLWSVQPQLLIHKFLRPLNSLPLKVWTYSIVDLHSLTPTSQSPSLSTLMLFIRIHILKT